MKYLFLAKWYTRIVSIFFIAVSISLVIDFVAHGFRPETMHKLFHVILGAIIFFYGWNNKQAWHWFPLINGAFFSYAALFGWLFLDFALNLEFEAFTRSDTILHSIVGFSGLLIAFLNRNSKQ